MFSKRYFYLIRFQYLGFRYHGWQKQPGLLTVERMVSRTLAYVLGHKNFKVLAAGRTDAKVSANSAYMELFIHDDPLDLTDFLLLFNQNLPQDVRALEISEVDKSFNVIDAPKTKEYLYLFSFGTKNHPFAAPFIVYKKEPLAISKMKEAARLFEGAHDFRTYTYKPTPETKTEGVIECCEIVPNDVFTANFFPEESFMLRVRGKGFKRHQIRLMMGVLFDVGIGKFDRDFVEKTLEPGNAIKLEHIAQPSGLILHDVQL